MTLHKHPWRWQGYDRQGRFVRSGAVYARTRLGAYLASRRACRNDERFGIGYAGLPKVVRFRA